MDFGSPFHIEGYSLNRHMGEGLGSADDGRCYSVYVFLILINKALLANRKLDRRG